MSLNSIVIVPAGSSPMPRLSAQHASRAGTSDHATHRADRGGSIAIPAAYLEHPDPPAMQG
jgi:hypothetical protein